MKSHKDTKEEQLDRLELLAMRDEMVALVEARVVTTRPAREEEGPPGTTVIEPVMTHEEAVSFVNALLRIGKNHGLRKIFSASSLSVR